MAFIQDAQLGENVNADSCRFFLGQKTRGRFSKRVHKWMCKNMDLDGFGFPKCC